MTNRIDDIKKSYEPLVKDVENLCGLSMNSAGEGEQVNVLRKHFFTSYEDNHRRFFDEILGVLLGPNLGDLNRALIVIRENKAYIYKNYPMTLKIKPKEDVEAHKAVFEHQVLDIIGVKFRDAVFNLDVKDGDKFLWLFRDGWSFGLYFDFSGEMKVDDLWGELGTCYRKIKYYSLYSFLSAENNFDRLLARGWFPFVQILGDEFDRLRVGIDHNDAREMAFAEKSVIESFTQERIGNFTKYWWRNEIFQKKRELLTAGINAYLRADTDGIISCIKTLTSEIEGIIRLDYHRTKGKTPNTRELKDYVLAQGQSKFSAPDSRGFPGLFFKYLESVVFRGFDVDKDDVELSRHSVGHGVAAPDKYTRIQALQLILVLDQIHFYLGETKSTVDE